MRCAIAQAKREPGQESLSSVSISALRVRWSETTEVITVYGQCLADVELPFVRAAVRLRRMHDYLSLAPLPKCERTILRL